MKLLCSVLVMLLCFIGMVELARFSYSCSPPSIKNGKYRYRRRGKFVKYSCNLGYVLYGDKYNNCVNGTWDGPPPRCVRPGCKKVNAPNNGSIYPTFAGAVLHFFCKPGYELHGPDVTHCNGTKWSSNMPICLNSSTKPPLSCDFENPDLCGWTHDLNHDFDWRREQFGTPSGAIGTGPSRDHTIGSKYNPKDPTTQQSGFYMYIESSSKNENDTARLISPVYENTPNNTCFVFFYHMFGTTIGTLRVYLKLVNESWDLKPHRAFFEEHGNQGDRWIRGIHLFDYIADDYQIIIEGVRGSGYVSDIAIDDVSIVNNCNLDDFQDTEISTTTEAEQYSTTDYQPNDLFNSCEGKCEFGSIRMRTYFFCFCDDYCFDRNDCCPDYIDFCLIHDPITTLYEESEPTTDIIFKNTPTTIPSTPRTTYRTTTSTTTTTTTTTTTAKPTTTRNIITNTQPEVTTTQPNIPKVQTIFILPETTTKDTHVEIITEDEEIDQITEDIDINPDWEATNNIPNEIPMFPNEMAPIEDVAHLKHSKEKIVILKYAEKRSYLVYYIIGLGFVMAGMILVIVRRKNGNRSRRFRSGSHGGSASDVRFLTSDELLDLNLDYE